MGYLALFVLAALGHSASAKSWGGYDYHRPTGHYHHSSGNHHNFDYNTWCHSAGGWDGDSWEDSNSSPEDYDDKSRPLKRAGGWDGSDSWEDSSSEESQKWDDYNHRSLRSTTTKRSVVIHKTQSEGTSSTSTRLSVDTGSTPSPLELPLCLRMCPITSEYSPVCGTDNITYRNPGRLQCAISCGINVALKSSAPCQSNNLGTTQPTSPAATTLSPQVLATCMRSCMVTSEYNPVCGTDNITYNNPSRLECAKGCGKPVSMLLLSRCPPPDQLTSTTTTSTTTALSPQLLAMCMKSCSVTSEYNPVCGTDNITYTNPSSLNCAKDCGKPVSVLLPSRCPSPGQLKSTTTRSTPASISPVSTTPMAPTSTSARPTSPNPGPTPLAGPTTKFTIAQNILDAIFNSTTESLPDFSLDERFEGLY